MDKKIKFQCAIYMGKYGINVYSNYPKTFDILRKGSFIPFIPEYQCLKRKVESDYSIIYIENKISSAKMLNGNKTLEIKGPAREIAKTSAIAYGANYMLEQLRQENSIFMTQGAGVSKKGKAVLLMGKRGAGKTSLTLELCRKYGFKYIGNDIVLVGLKKDRGYFFGGAEALTLRFTTVKYYNTDLQKLFKKAQNEWTDKITLLPENLGISIERGQPKIIKAFYIHLLNDEKAPLFIKRIEDKESLNMGRLFLYEELTRYIRGVCILMLWGSKFLIGDYLSSLDKPQYHKNRVSFIDWLMDKVGFYFISGSMDAICNFINQELGEKEKSP